ncbi:MAG: chain length determinant protein tyrosine kinase EpsG [Ideonella sp.]|jgi:receptor protein-tyrosine kinase|nr:chain length determinant protein tyrosine kinase EpsG [Ideonella sp.]
MKMSSSPLQEVRRINRTIGAMLVDAGLVSEADIDRVLHYQREHGLRFGEAAIRLGIVSESDVQFALARQFDYAYLPSDATNRPVSEQVVAAYQPFSSCVDQLVAIRSQLMLRWFDRGDQRQVLTIVGTDRREGRSYLASNLAVVFSQLGQRTLLIDANMRNPRQHELFRLENQVGLSTVLSGRAQTEVVVRIPDLLGLTVMPAGPVPPNPLELLSRPLLPALLAHARQSYDVVLVDTPALSVGDDAAIIAMRSGAALAVARSGQTRLPAYNDLVRGLSDAGVAVVGSVLNDVPQTADGPDAR